MNKLTIAAVLVVAGITAGGAGAIAIAGTTEAKAGERV